MQPNNSSLNPVPKISIITPSYNQGQFIEQTILSVIDQDYSNIEYIVIDGGSTDDTMAVVEKYKDRITYCISEPDKGQPNALNKGLRVATGDIIAFINSDDYYEPGVFKRIAESYLEGNDWIVGSVRNFQDGSDESEIVHQVVDGNLDNWVARKNQNHQPGNFWSRRVFERVGYFDELLHYTFDWEYWIRFSLAGFAPVVLDGKVLAHFRLHETSKTVKQWMKFNGEFIALMNKYKQYVSEDVKEQIDRDILKINVDDKIRMARIESINGSFGTSFNLFKEVVRLKPATVFSFRFVYEFAKALIYMPVRKKFS